MYSLADEEEEEEDLLQRGPGGAPAWAAEVGLLALHACVLLQAADQPAWLRQLLLGMQAHAPEAPGDAGGEEEASVQALMQRSALSATMAQLRAAAGEQQPLLPALLAGADWRRLAAVVHAEEATAGGAVPWLLLPALLAGDSLGGGDLGSRLVYAASLLNRGAALQGTPHAAETAACAAGALLLCTLCQGTRHEQRPPPPAAARDASAVEDAALAAALAESARLAQQEQVVIPEGFPRELLEGTVEGQQLLLLQQQQEEQRAAQQADVPAGAAGGAAPGAAGGREQQAPPREQPGAQQHEQQGAGQQEIVEVRGCWSLTPGQHVALLQQALLPLAAARASNDAAGAWQQEDCPPELLAPNAASALREWRGPHLPDLLHAAAAAAAAAPQTGEAASEAAATAAATACVAAALAPLVRPPVTVLLQDGLPFANSELPLDTEGAVFVSVGPEAGGSAGGADASVVRSQLLVALQVRGGSRAGTGAVRACANRVSGKSSPHYIAMRANFYTLSNVTACLPRRLPASSPGATRWRPACCACCTPAQRCTPRQQPWSCRRACCASWQHRSRMAGLWGKAPPLLRVLAPRPRCPAQVGRAWAAAQHARVLSAAPARGGSRLACSGSPSPVARTGWVSHTIPAPLACAPPPPPPPSCAGLMPAITATQGLPAGALLGLAESAAQLHAPLTAALALERLRQGSTVLPKDEWQAQTTRVRSRPPRAAACIAFHLGAPRLHLPQHLPPLAAQAAMASHIQPHCSACAGAPAGAASCAAGGGQPAAPARHGGGLAGSAGVGGRPTLAAPQRGPPPGRTDGLAGGPGAAGGGPAAGAARGLCARGLG